MLEFAQMIWKFLRSLLFRLDPEIAHWVGGVYLRFFGFIRAGKAPKFHARRRRRFELAGFSLESPLGIAAGFDKDAQYIPGLIALGFGFIEVGSVTPLAQNGNPRPRVFRLPHSRALINRMGFNSAGADVVAERLEYLRAMHRISTPIGVNLGKNRNTPLEFAARDYSLALQRLYPYADYLVVNISSPNTPGLTDLQEGDALPKILKAVRSSRDQSARLAPGALKPLFLKLSPDLHEQALKSAVDFALEEGFGIIATNTSRRRDFPGIAAEDKALLQQEGGLSGAPLRAEALERIAKLRGWMGPKACLISVGGLGDAQDAEARLAAGANLLQVYTEFLYSGPSYPKVMAERLR